MPNPLPPKRIQTSNEVALLVVDVQERLVDVVLEAPALLRQIERLLSAAQCLDIPALATEQYPRGLGPTVPSIRSLLAEPPVSKMRFSALVPEIQARLDRDRAVVLVGIETHVCIAQTAAELLDAGFRVILPRDAVSARAVIDHETALGRMAAFGAEITTCEALLFEWLGTAEHPRFKTISNLVKHFATDQARDSG